MVLCIHACIGRRFNIGTTFCGLQQNLILLIRACSCHFAFVVTQLHARFMKTFTKSFSETFIHLMDVAFYG